MKKTIAGAILGLVIAGSAPVLPVDIFWKGGQETQLWDTPSGDMEVGYYYNIDGEECVTRLKDDRDHNDWVVVDCLTLDTQNLTPAKVIGNAHYDFYTDGLETYRYPITQKEYRDVAFVKDFPQPAPKVVHKSVIAGVVADAAIAHDNATNSGAQTTATSYSWSHTTSTDNPVLVVSLGVRQTAPTASVTYNSVSMTQATTTSIGTAHIFGFYLAAPATGANTVAVTISATPTSSSAGAESMTGVDQVSPFVAKGSALSNAASSPITATVVTVNDGEWIVDGIQANSNAVTAGGSATLRNSVDQITTRFFRQSTLGPVSPAGSTNMTYTWSGTNNNAFMAMSFKPFIAPATSGTTDDNFIIFD